MHPPPDVFAGSQVTLRRAMPHDGAALFAVACNPRVMRFMDWPMPKESEEVHAHLRKADAEWQEGREFQWVILENSTRQLTGTISCRPRGHSADFGYFLGPSHWGKGLAFEAATQVTGWLLHQPEILRIWATADAENERSRRLLERIGLRLEGILRMATYRPNIGGKPRDTALYAVCKSDA